MTSQATQTTRIYAHRGSTLLAPENTALAFDLALELGADVLETDVRLCADNELIVIHDATLERTTNGKGWIRNRFADELTNLDAGYHHRDLEGRGYRRQGIQLMTLDEMLGRYPDVEINIDLKDNTIDAADALARTLKRFNRLTRVTVGSFHRSTLLHFRDLLPEVATVALKEEVFQLYFQLSAARQHPLSYQSVQIPASYKMIPLTTRRFTRLVKAKKKSLVYWTINDPNKIRQLFDLGVDGIVTDRTDLATDIIKSGRQY